MVSDAQLVERLRLFLRSSNLAMTSYKTVRCQLESDFSVDLADKKPFIRDQVDIFLAELEFERTRERAMVSDAQLVERLRLFLRFSNLATTSYKTVRCQLESDFSIDLADKKPFIQDQVDIFVAELEFERTGEEWMEGNLGSGDVEEESVEEEVKSNEKESMKCGPPKPNEVKKRGVGLGFTKLCTLSPHLQEVIGVSELTRPLVVKKLWEYIRENNLQNPSNRKQIICDDRLQSLFKAKTIHMLQITKALSVHIWPLNSDGPSNSKRTKKRGRRTNGSKESSQKGVTSGFMAPIQLSDAGEDDVGVR